jgi:hypothetical protein
MLPTQTFRRQGRLSPAMKLSTGDDLRYEGGCHGEQELASKEKKGEEAHHGAIITVLQEELKLAREQTRLLEARLNESTRIKPISVLNHHLGHLSSSFRRVGTGFRRFQGCFAAISIIILPSVRRVMQPMLSVLVGVAIVATFLFTGSVIFLGYSNPRQNHAREIY